MSDEQTVEPTALRKNFFAVRGNEAAIAEANEISKKHERAKLRSPEQLERAVGRSRQKQIIVRGTEVEAELLKRVVASYDLSTIDVVWLLVREAARKRGIEC